MLLVLLGPPGAGKGTQAKLIVKKKNLFHFSTGDILRNEVTKQSDIGKKIENIINEGNLVSDQIILSIVDKVVSENSSKFNGILFDGFPRNLEQANAFDDLLGKRKKKIDLVLHISIEKDEIITRIKKRQSEESRKDDNLEVVNSRINVYYNETKPLIDKYKKKNILKTLNGMQSIDDVNKDVFKSIEKVS